MIGQFCRSCGTPRVPGGGAGCSCEHMEHAAPPPLRPVPPHAYGATPAFVPDGADTAVLPAYAAAAAPYAEPCPDSAYPDSAFLPPQGGGPYGQAPHESAQPFPAYAQMPQDGQLPAPYAQPLPASVQLPSPYAQEAPAAPLPSVPAQRTPEQPEAQPPYAQQQTASSGDTGPAAEPAPAGPLPPLAATPAPPAGALPPHAPAAKSGRRPMKAVALGMTAAAVLGTAAFTSGMFSGGSEGDALADATRAGQPDSVPDDTAAGPSQPAARSALTTPDRQAGQARQAAKTPAVPAAAHRAQDAAATSDGTLSLGDSGPQVAALQRKLSALYLYHGADDGSYGQSTASAVRIYQMYRHVQGDQPGVYGQNTRRALEAEPAHQQAAHHSSDTRQAPAEHTASSGQARQAALARQALARRQEQAAEARIRAAQGGGGQGAHAQSPYGAHWQGGTGHAGAHYGGARHR
ncbi:peptidoglycan-binding domain-containing protein [Streptomyces sp. NPDC047002]|uniref:peptidoglycan-binding domain-containing protein n=1 Tax=Streptomyces sp. NPDC047002 TaxID=3155475 RepID=UPI0034545052